MRGIATLVCALSLSVAASGCCGGCGGCGPCGKGYPTASAPSYNSGSTYAASNSAPTSADLGGISPTSGGSSVAPASYEEAVGAEPSVEMEDEAPSDRTTRRRSSSTLE
jgi:hypothetical protein